MALTKQSSSAVFALASQVMGDRTASEQAKLLAATVLTQAPLPPRRRAQLKALAER
jgi:hypothetical protein